MNFPSIPFLQKVYAKRFSFFRAQLQKYPWPKPTCRSIGRIVFNRLCLINIGVLSLLTGNAQFYYTDIVLASRNTEQLKLYKANQVREIKLISYEATGERSENFAGEVSVDAAYSKTTTYTSAPASGASWLTTFYLPDGKPVKSVDSSAENVHTSTYTYNENGMLTSAHSISATAKGKDQQSESHIWLYDAHNKPQKMLWIKNGNDTSIVQFKTDETGNVTEEEVFYKGSSKNTTYYYYDKENRMTDIVRYNDRLKKLMPDNIFEYNDRGGISQMISVQNGSDYLIWKYEYNDKGLRIRELCYNKQKQLLGRIEYQY